MSLSAILFLDLKGQILLSRDYRGDIPIELAADNFTDLVIGGNGQAELGPVVSSADGISYLYLRHNNVYLVAVTGRNSLAMTILVFLRKLLNILTDYFGTVEEESVRDNFVLIYELLDEVMDFGMPQITEPQILQEYITQKGFRLENPATLMGAPSAVTGPVSWRREGIKHKKNEVFLDVIESVNMLVNSQGQIINGDISGALKIRSMLSGMPELRLGLNDKVLFEQQSRIESVNPSKVPSKTVEMEDFRFHQCVRLNKFESERTISFIPPDGEFELLSYRCPFPAETQAPVWVETVIEKWSSSRIEMLVTVRSQLKKKQAAHDVEVLVPVPEDSDSPKFKTSAGYATFKPERSAILWHVGNIPQGKEFTMRARLSRPSVKADDADEKDFASLPIKVGFEIPYTTISGLQVRYLKVVEKSGYTALPWVRYVTQNGDCAFRMPEHKTV